MSKKDKKTSIKDRPPIFCARVKERREALGLTGQQLGDLILMPHQSVYRLESGKLPRDEWRLVAIAKALDVSLDWLFGLDE